MVVLGESSSVPWAARLRMRQQQRKGKRTPQELVPVLVLMPVLIPMLHARRQLARTDLTPWGMKL